MDPCLTESCTTISLCTPISDYSPSAHESQTCYPTPFPCGMSTSPEHDLSWTNTDESDNDDPDFGSLCPTVLSSTAIAQNKKDALPLLVVDEKSKVEVHISDPEYQHFSEAEVLKIATVEDFRRLQKHETRPNLAINCFRDRIETLEKEVSRKEKTLKIEKEAAITEIIKFWRNCIMEGNTCGVEK